MQTSPWELSEQTSEAVTTIFLWLNWWFKNLLSAQTARLNAKHYRWEDTVFTVQYISGPLEPWVHMMLGKWRWWRLVEVRDQRGWRKEETWRYRFLVENKEFLYYFITYQKYYQQDAPLLFFLSAFHKASELGKRQLNRHIISCGVWTVLYSTFLLYENI